MSPAARLPRKIHIIGGEGSGKSTLAATLGAALEIPVHHLDNTAWVPLEHAEWETFHPQYQPPVRIAVRPLAERMLIAEGIAAAPDWVTEGKHLVWTDSLMAAADQIIWLDHVPFRLAARRVLGRSVGSSLRESRQRRGLSRFIRLSYARHGGEVFMQLGRLARFYVDQRAAIPPSDAYGRITRGTIRAALAPHADKVIRITSDAALGGLLTDMGALSIQLESTSP